MYVKDLEARQTKSCHFYIGHGGKCVGTQCMMWRWYHRQDYNKLVRTEYGYCGHAGKPEGEPK